MADFEDEGVPTTRIVKKKTIQGGSHGGSWKVAYADFVTAMMALFIVLWIMGQSQAIRDNVAQYFKNPGVLTGSRGIMETSGLSGNMPTPGHSQDLQRAAPVPSEFDVEKGALEQARKHIEEVIAQLPDLKALKDQISLTITSEGLRIELMEKEDSLFFDIGSAVPKPKTKELFKIISQELGKLPNRVAIEGHTDSRPYGGQNYTNWELSVDRANAARRLLETDGLRPGQVYEVRGHADQMLINPQDPHDFCNRRVSIIVLYKDKVKTCSFTTPLADQLNNADIQVSTPAGEVKPLPEPAVVPEKPSESPN
ncbi:MAG: flagellar motor protein MotB [Desulfobacca sp.]|nr:flagellar motor protein MotB [Desulfobacca sp.]